MRHRYTVEDASAGGKKGGSATQKIPVTGKEGQEERDEAGVKLSKIHDRDREE